MSEGEAEKKKIAELRFGIGEAEANLKVIDEKLEAISKKADKLDLGKNLSIDTTKIKADYKNLDKIVKDYGKNSLNTILKDVKAANDAERQKEVAAYKSTLRREEYNERLAQNTKTTYDKISEYAKTYLIYQGFNELKRIIPEVIQEMTEMEYQMVAIDRVLNESSLDIDHYRDKLIQLAYDYGNSFDNVADITLRLAQAGFDSQEALALTEKTLLALNTAELNATQATDDMVAVMAQWNLMTGTATEQANAYGSIIDKVNKVADNFPTTSADIMDALKKVSSAFNLAGASIDETIATIVAAEKASQRGGKVIGTALSNITQQLRAEGRLNLAEEMGLDFYTDDAKTTFKPIMGIFQEMAERMEKLKAEGKESSVEMQNLLELFTVFRRNIGASLLGEMSGEDSTYADALTASLNSLGYSLQENEKYMKTAKAAQEQFNATLLQLKVSVWDNGLEDVFRTMLALGNDMLNVLKFLTDNLGALPTILGVVTLAFSALNKNLKVSEWMKMSESVKKVNQAIKESKDGVVKYGNSLKGTNETFRAYVKSVGQGEVSLKGYKQYLAQTTKETALLTLKTVALQAAVSLGLTVAITVITTALDKLIHAEENAAEAAQERINETTDAISKTKEEIDSIDTAIKAYEDLQKAYASGEEIEDKTKIKEVQEQITVQLKEQRRYTTDLKDDYDAQLQKLKEISKEKREQLIKDQQSLVVNTENAKRTADFGEIDWFGKRQDVLDKLGFNYDYFNQINKDLGNTFMDPQYGGIFGALDRANFEEQLKILTEMNDKLLEAYYSRRIYR